MTFRGQASCSYFTQVIGCGTEVHDLEGPSQTSCLFIPEYLLTREERLSSQKNSRKTESRGISEHRAKKPREVPESKIRLNRHMFGVLGSELHCWAVSLWVTCHGRAGPSGVSGDLSCHSSSLSLIATFHALETQMPYSPGFPEAEVQHLPPHSDCSVPAWVLFSPCPIS